MEILKFTIAAGETKRFEKAGRYIEVLEADNPLSLFFFDVSGSQADDAQGIVSGLYIEAPYKAFTVASVSAQSITLLIADGRGGSRRQPGNVAIIDRIDVSCMTTGIADATLGASATALVLPAANVSGLIIRSSIVEAQPGASGAANVRLIAALTSPASVVPGANSVILNSAYGDVSASAVRSTQFEQRRRIPPGWGLYFVKNVTSVAAAVAAITVSYELL